jgi:hypothetical protein
MEGIVFTLLLLIVVYTAASTPTSRTVTFVNQCDTDYFIAPTSAAAPYVAGVSSCHSNADCETGSSCLLANHICYYDVPTPTSGSFSVLAGKTNQIIFPFYNNGDPSHWVGNFGFCGGDMPCTQTEEVCNQNGCGVNLGPSNIAEINFLKNEDDYYDVSNVNGMNVPMSLSPTVINPSIFMSDNPYQCGTPGSQAPVTNMGISSWDPTPPSAYYQWVVPSSTTCLQDSDCSNGDSCGLTNNYGETPQFKLSCGKLLGYWTANQACGQDPTNLLQDAGFGCFTPVVNGGIITTLGAMQGCGGTSGSGYSDGAAETVCGCQDWYKLFGSEVVPLETGNCSNSNPIWMTSILPTLQWLKEICPSCYVYPYDDKSSTFTCYLAENGYNIQNYTVTLCPYTPTPAPATAAPTKPPTAAPTKPPTAAPTKPQNAAQATTRPAATSKPAPTKPQNAAQDESPDAESVESINACSTTACGSNTVCCDDVTLGPTCYNPSDHSCVSGSEGTVLCGAGSAACGLNCYDPLTYECCNNELYGIDDTNSPCTASSSRRSLLDLDLPITEFASDSSHVFYGCWLFVFIISFFIVNACV